MCRNGIYLPMRKYGHCLVGYNTATDELTESLPVVVTHSLLSRRAVVENCAEHVPLVRRSGDEIIADPFF